MDLPQEFLNRMKKMLGDEFDEFLSCYDKPHFKGVRLNTLKCDWQTLQKSLPVTLRESPFSPLCRYADGLDRVGALAAHHAGMFYSQEPSASSAVTALNPQPGDRVLDLCAAPGGKSTQIAALLSGEGLLWSNEIVKSRANILLSNIERMGIKNAVVSSCHPQKLCESLTGFFDRVLVDAPCSGEGMFRRDPVAAAEWTPESPAACALRQRAILDSAAMAVAQGGVLVYSTCTFSPEENEETAAAFLAAHPEFEPAPIEVEFGRPAMDGSPGRRIFPMDGGEGHFVVKFRRVGENTCKAREFSQLVPAKEAKEVQKFYEGIFNDKCGEKIAKLGEKYLLLPSGLPSLNGLGVLRAGVELGEQKAKRIEPTHGLFMSHSANACRQSINFESDSPELAAFLRGEEIDCECTGYTAVCVNGVVTGFGKASGGRLKNRYPKGLRNNK